MDNVTGSQSSSPASAAAALPVVSGPEVSDLLAMQQHIPAATGKSLSGTGGADVIDGGYGAQSMSGGAGNDVYIVSSQQDTVGEKSGGGTDTLLSWVGFHLPANVENLVMLGNAGGWLTGNSLDNILVG